jgi:ArsR family transcriptional regulator
MEACDLEGMDPERLERLKKIIKEVPSEDVFYENSDYIKSIADPTRLKIIYLLKYGELCVCEIQCAIDKPQPTISHHLNILKKSGLLKWRKEGVWIHYRLSDPEIYRFIDKLLQCK